MIRLVAFALLPVLLAGCAAPPGGDGAAERPGRQTSVERPRGPGDAGRGEPRGPGDAGRGEEPRDPAQRDGQEARLVEVVDGDTARFVVDGRDESVRLIGVNAPEQGECFADEATRRLRELLSEGPLSLRRDVSDRDQFGRLLRYVRAGDMLVNEALVEGGFALANRYPPDVARADELEAAQERAQAEQRGLWAADACGAAAAGEIEIAEINHDPPGDESADLNAEWVELRNPGGAPLQLGGWGLKDESASHRYAFPDDFALAPGASVRVHSGCGEDSTEALHWCVSGSAVWNNDGDTVFVLDPRGNVAASASYD